MNQTNLWSENSISIKFIKFDIKISWMITRIAPAMLGLRQALKISIYDYLPKCHQINAELVNVNVKSRTALIHNRVRFL